MENVQEGISYAQVVNKVVNIGQHNVPTQNSVHKKNHMQVKPSTPVYPVANKASAATVTWHRGYTYSPSKSDPDETFTIETHYRFHVLQTHEHEMSDQRSNSNLSACPDDGTLGTQGVSRQSLDHDKSVLQQVTAGTDIKHDTIVDTDKVFDSIDQENVQYNK